MNKKASKTDDASFLAEARERYQRGYDKDRDNIDAAYEDLRFMSGRTEDQWPAEAIEARKDRPVITVPQIPKFVRQVTGDMRLSKPGIKVVPVDNRGDKKTAEVLAGMVRYVETRSSARFAYTKGADSQVAAGMGAWRVITEYAEATTFNQELRILAVDDGVSVIWDPDAILPTREDAMYCFVPIDISSALFKKQYPDASPSDFGEWQGWSTADTVRIAEYWEKRPEDRLLALLPDGSIDDLSNKDAAEVEALRAQGARIEKRPSFCVYRSLICAGSVLEEPKKWPGRYIPVVPVLGEEVNLGRSTHRRGIVRHMKDSQRLYNYGLSAQAEVTALQPKAPFMVTDVNVKKFIPEWEQANSANLPFLRYEPDKMNGGAAPQRIQPPVSSQGIAELLMRAVEDMKSTTGIYDAGLGAQSNETSGKAIAARQREADVGTFVYMDNWSLSIEYTGRILIDLIPHIYDTQRVIRIIGEDGKVETVEINKTQRGPVMDGAPAIIENDVTVGAYDVVMETGPSYSTRREEAKEGMLTFLQSSPEVSPIIADLVAKAQDWPMADEIAERIEVTLPAPIRELIESKKPPEERKQPPPPDPRQEAAVELELEDKAAGIEKTRAEAANKNAATQKTQAELALMTGATPEMGQAMMMMAAAIQQQGQQIAALTAALQPQPAEYYQPQ